MDIKELWKNWDGIHDEPDQIKRIESATKANMTPKEIDTESLTGVFSGSAIYNVTLDSCNCSDFRNRRKPCKHMYRLAIELGLIDKEFKTDKSKIRVLKSERADLPTLVEVIEESLTESEITLLRKLLLDVLFHTQGKPTVTEVSKEADSIIGHGFFVESDDTSVLLDRVTRTDLFARLESIGITNFKKNMKLIDLKAFTNENVQDLRALFKDKYVLNVNPKLAGVQRKLYTYLIRRDDNEVIMTAEGTFVEVPKGAYFNSDGYTEFPNDDITELLNKYGKNRVLK